MVQRSHCRSVNVVQWIVATIARPSKKVVLTNHSSVSTTVQIGHPLPSLMSLVAQSHFKEESSNCSSVINRVSVRYSISESPMGFTHPTIIKSAELHFYFHVAGLLGSILEGF